LVLVVATLLGACAPEVITPPAVTVTSVPVEHRIVVPSPPDDPMPSEWWPLTGLSAEDAAPADLERVAIGVKIENTPEARPQTGLEYADIVFEEYINDSCVRLMAIFHTTHPSEVGPVRSARNMDPNIIGSFYGVLVASGTNSAVKWGWPDDQLFLAEDFRGQTGILHESEGFERVNPRSSMHSLRANLPLMADTAVAEGVPSASQQFVYAYPDEIATATVEGAPVGTIDIRFSANGHPHWVWDAVSGLWQRFEYTKEDVTKDGNPITAANVIILRVVVKYTNGKNPESLVIVPEATGFVATGGKVVQILWSKADRRGKFLLTTFDGRPVYLEPGQTWIELVPLSGVVRDKAVIKFDDVVQP
jgi:hypothetical protein